MEEGKRPYASFNIGCDGFVQIYVTPDELREMADRLENGGDIEKWGDGAPKIKIPSGNDFELYLVMRE